MFLESSRYYDLKSIKVKTPEGRETTAVVFRKFPSFSETNVKRVAIQEGDRLDVIAYREYNDATRFWHIADANTELQACELTKEINRVISIPEQ